MVHDADEAQFEQIHTSRDSCGQVIRVYASIHQDQLGEDANCPLAMWVDGSRKLEGVKVGEIYASICG